MTGGVQTFSHTVLLDGLRDVRPHSFGPLRSCSVCSVKSVTDSPLSSHGSLALCRQGGHGCIGTPTRLQHVADTDLLSYWTVVLD